MTHQRFCDALVKIRPGAVWSAPVDCVSVDDERFEWGGQNLAAKPSQAELAAALGAVDAETSRNGAIDDSIRGRTLGATQPATLAQLKAMTLQEYETWFDANFDTAAKAISFVKILGLMLIRRA